MFCQVPLQEPRVCIPAIYNPSLGELSLKAELMKVVDLPTNIFGSLASVHSRE